MLKIALLIVHVSFAAVLFGAPMGLVGNVRRALRAGDEALRIAAIDAMRRARMAGISSLVTLLTGIALIFVMGGFGSVATHIHAALGVMILAVAFSAAVMRPNSAKLVAAAQAQPADRTAAESALKKLAMGSGVLHLLWVILLTLMFYKF